jgi:hypothetical protein
MGAGRFRRVEGRPVSLRPAAAPTVCCVCGQPCEQNPKEIRDRWSWGPDGMHVHFKCEREFARRWPGSVPEGHRIWTDS